MRRALHHQTWSRAGLALVATASFFVLPQSSFAFGRNGQRPIVNKAVDTLPFDVRAFFEAGRTSLAQHVTDPLDSLVKSPSEKRNHFIALDKYGRFPYESLPRSYKAALSKFGKVKL